MDLVREFLCRSLVAAGGVVEEEGEALHALLPEAAAGRLGLPDETRIELGSARPADEGAVDGRLGSAFLERLVGARLAAAPLAAVALPAELPRGLPEDVPVLLNAVRAGVPVRLPATARILVAELRVVLHAEELRSHLATVAIRLADGALVAPLDLGPAYGVAAAPLDEDERRRAAGALGRWVRAATPGLVAGALETLGRRAARDLERMAEYYASLDREMAAAAGRARSEEERARRRQKRAGLAAELEARRAQLRERMRARVATSLVAATLVETAADRFTLAVRRRRGERPLDVLCRAADRRFEGPRCAACGVATLRLYLCDERLHVLCERCGQAGRLDPARCRACTRAPAAPLAVAVDDPTARLVLGAG